MIDDSYGDEVEINYFEQTSENSGLYTLKARDKDSVMPDQIEKVKFSIDRRGHFVFQ